jgi:hypothetical protein
MLDDQRRLTGDLEAKVPDLAKNGDFVGSG